MNKLSQFDVVLIFQDLSCILQIFIFWQICKNVFNINTLASSKQLNQSCQFMCQNERCGASIEETWTLGLIDVFNENNVEIK